jgi:hypothetical protein
MRALSKVESVKDSENKTIKNSQAAFARETLEEAGIYDEVVEAIGKTGADASSVKLSKTIMGMSPNEFKAFLAELQKYGK